LNDFQFSNLKLFRMMYRLRAKPLGMGDKESLKTAYFNDFEWLGRGDLNPSVLEISPKTLSFEFFSRRYRRRTMLLKKLSDFQNRQK